MMAKLMKWRLWPPVLTRKFKVNLKVQSLEGVSRHDEHDLTMMVIEMQWRGSRGRLRYHFGRRHKRERTSEKGLVDAGCTINWQEDFEDLCVLTISRHTGFLPFYVHFAIVKLGTKSKATILGTATMNLADLAPLTQTEMPVEHTARLNFSNLEGLQKHVATLVITVRFSEVIESPILECSRPATLPCLSSAFLCDQQIRGMCDKKVKDIRKTVSLGWKKRSGELDIFVCNGKLSPSSDKSFSDAEELAGDTDSLDSSEETRVVKKENQILQSYGSLTDMNLVAEGALPTLTEIRQDPSAVPGKVAREPDANEASTSEPEQSTHLRSLISWKTRRQKVRTPPDRGEPLLRKAQSEAGGDDIDHDRWLSLNYTHDQSDSAMLSSAAISECLDCGEIQFTVGCWERKEFVNRVGHMKLSTEVFFASIDQRSERAGGESACTALVVVIADWLHKNPDRMPIRAELDTLIRQGSCEWRTLCNIEGYRKRFPDRHFDLDTVLEAEIRPLGIVEGSTSVGFFKPEGENGVFDFLCDTVSFDDMWETAIIEESLMPGLDGTFKPAVFIVSWNDHFFLLKVDREAYYIIDTLGERLYEGCKKAYILCFDKDTSLSLELESDKVVDGRKSPIKSLSSSPPSTVTGSLALAPSDPSNGFMHQQKNGAAQENGIDPQEKENNISEYKGREACKQFIKGFYASLPLRQLHMDMKKGLLGTSPLHQRLQIEFHRTFSYDIPSSPLVEGTSHTLHQSSSPPLVEETSRTPHQSSSPPLVEDTSHTLHRSSFSPLCGSE